jgi:hypothetical protein
MQGAGLAFVVLAALMGVLIFCEIWSERLLGAFHWLTLARYPRGFPIIVAIQVLTFLSLLFLAAMFALR